jgi:hypothetical protein
MRTSENRIKCISLLAIHLSQLHDIKLDMLVRGLHLEVIFQHDHLVSKGTPFCNVFLTLLLFFQFCIISFDCIVMLLIFFIVS